MRPAAPLAGRHIESELVLYSDLLAERQKQVQALVDDKIRNHQRWNLEYIDVTRQPLSEIVAEPNPENGFRTAHTQYLMTPPASQDGSDEDMLDAAAPNFETALAKFVGQPEDANDSVQPAYRRRIGRGNRLWIDRRGLKSASNPAVEQDVLDRWKYDSDDDEDPPMYEVDPWDVKLLQYRATIPYARTQPTPNSQQAQNAANVQTTNAAPRPAITSAGQATSPPT